MDATFLFSEVDIIAEWALYNSNPQQVEYRLHQFFYEIDGWHIFFRIKN